MNINFDILVSGCNTRCKHCYVNGGPGSMMKLEDALLFIEKLDALAEFLPFEASFTLDNEPMNHPDIAPIIRKAATTRYIEHYHHGMTSGIALMRRKDRHAVMQAYLDCGYRDFGITIHGNAAHHDEIVRREGALKIAIEAAEFMKSCGAEVGASLMFNRFFAEDADEIDGMLQQLQSACHLTTFYYIEACRAFFSEISSTFFCLCSSNVPSFCFADLDIGSPESFHHPLLGKEELVVDLVVLLEIILLGSPPKEKVPLNESRKTPPSGEPKKCPFLVV